MINSIIAYDISSLEKRKTLSKIKVLYKKGFLKNEQFQIAKKLYTTNIFSPSIFIKILLFIVSYICLSTIVAPISLFLEGFLNLNLKQIHYQTLAFIMGILCFIFLEKILIKNSHHYKSGVTEACIFTGIGLIAFATLSSEPSQLFIYPLLGLLLCGLSSIRYLNITCLIATIFFFIWMIYEVLNQLGSNMVLLLPFVVMTFFLAAYFKTKNIEKQTTLIVFDNYLTVLKLISLVIFYSAGNYFVVRELSIELMNLELTKNEDIPFAIFFYLFTAITPLAILYFGIKNKSIFLIRVSILILVLSVITFKYYFSLGHPIVSITIAGAIIIIISLILLNYLKEIKFGFTREKLISNQTFSDNLGSFIASQTLGGNINEITKNDSEILNGGEFGGGGAGSKW